MPRALQDYDCHEITQLQCNDIPCHVMSYYDRGPCANIPCHVMSCHVTILGKVTHLPGVQGIEFSSVGNLPNNVLRTVASRRSLDCRNSISSAGINSIIFTAWPSTAGPVAVKGLSSTCAGGHICIVRPQSTYNSETAGVCKSAYGSRREYSLEQDWM